MNRPRRPLCYKLSGAGLSGAVFYIIGAGLSGAGLSGLSGAGLSGATVCLILDNPDPR